MIYLDYAANTPIEKEVLDVYYNTSIEYIANPNSPYKIGFEASDRLRESVIKVGNLLGAKENEVIFTSGASESNNMAIKGIAKNYARYGKHIISTQLEHASVTGPVTALSREGYTVDFVNIKKNGQVDLEHLKQLLREDTILVSICLVDSEIGSIQPISEIKKLIEHLPKCFLHVDATQAVGKIPVKFEDMDLLTFSGHKIYGPIGCGVLLRKEKVLLEPLIHGGHSTTTFRSGTPMLSLTAATEHALTVSLEKLEERYAYVKELNDYLRGKLMELPYVIMNTMESYTPYILNVTIQGVNTNKLQEMLSEKEIYVATKAACCAPNTVSVPVFAMTGDRKRSLSTLRISIGHATTKEELDIFAIELQEAIKNLPKK